MGTNTRMVSTNSEVIYDFEFDRLIIIHASSSSIERFANIQYSGLIK